MTVLYLIQSSAQVASSRTRAYAYLPYLRRAGVACRVLVWNSERFTARAARGEVPLLVHAYNTVHRIGVAALMLWRAHGADAVYIQKVVLPAWVMRWLGRGRRVVFDYDDALYALGPGQERGWRAVARRWRTTRFINCLRECSLVVLENDANRRWTTAHCPRTAIITGPIDTERYSPRPRAASGPVVLGWIGSPSTTGYLDLLAPIFEQLAAAGHPIVLHLIGSGAFESRHVTVRHFPWSLDDEVDALATFDIGLMPLTDDPWARGKGGYKILQYMAMGIPTVASPVGINAELIEPGITGYLAADTRQWVEAIEQLIADEPLRQRIGAQARARAVGRYSLAHYGPIFVDALVDGPARETARDAAVPAEGMTR